MIARFPVRPATVRANGLEFGLLEAGAGPLALCLHGFPDTAHTWRHLLPALAGAGFHAVAPFTRGYAPTEVPADGAYGPGALIAYAPDRWRRLVTLAVPPAALDPVLLGDYEQLKRFFYLFLFRDPLGFADALVASDGMAFLGRLWREWSPGYQAGEDLAWVRESLREPANLAAAIGYYRAVGFTGTPGGSPGTGRYAAEVQAADRQAPQPTLYLHGAADGCIGADLARGAEPLLAPSSRMVVVDDAGHFLHLEKPAEINEHI